MKTRLSFAVLFALALPLWAANNQILGWNNLGMHCMDSDYSVFSILPPYNTIESQLIVGGKLVTNSTPLNLPVTVTPATATLRIISQPTNGSLGVSNNVLAYFPNAGFTGSDTFTYAAWDGSKNSALATGTVSVAQGPYSLSIVSHAATNAPVGWPVAFAVVPTVTNNSSTVTFNWKFGDGSMPSTNQFA